MATDIDVRVPTGAAGLAATVSIPEAARAAVMFAHGSGSSRHSPRNRAVARQLNEAGGEVAQVVVVPGATHLFEEPGALDQVSRRAVDWFEMWLCHGTPMLTRPWGDAVADPTRTRNLIDKGR